MTLELWIGCIIGILILSAVTIAFVNYFKKTKAQGYNRAWLLNEELKRIHKRLDEAQSDNNAKIFWNNIQELQLEIFKLPDSKEV